MQHLTDEFRIEEFNGRFRIERRVRIVDRFLWMKSESMKWELTDFLGRPVSWYSYLPIRPIEFDSLHAAQTHINGLLRGRVYHYLNKAEGT